MKEFWVAFDKATHWSEKFLKKGYAHMFVVTYVDKQWLFINPIKSEFEIIILPEKGKADTIKELRKKYTLLYVRTKKNKSYQFMGFQLFTCVRLIKYIVGFKMFCVTPYGFVKKLLKKKKNNKLPKNVLDVKLIK